MPRAIAALVLLCSVTFFAGLGRPGIADSDEAFYAESAREMLERHDWLTPYFNYQVRFQKPILFYWMVGAAYVVGGVGAAAARFPAALAGLGLVLLTYLCARRWYDERVGLLAGAITATNFGYFAMARQSLPDLPLAFFITLAIWSGLEGLALSPSRAGPSRRSWMLLASTAAACAFLTKGPVGVAVPALAVAPALLLDLRGEPEGLWAGLRRRIRTTDLVLSLAVFGLVAAPWFLAMWQVHGSSYLHRFFVAENLERFATARYNAPRGWWFYPPIILAGLLPWSPFVLLWGHPVVRLLRGDRRLTAVELQLIIWAGTILIFYTASIGKQPRYILPTLPPLAVLLARTISQRLARRGPGAPTDWLLAASGSLAAALLVGLGMVVWGARPLLEAINPGGIGPAAILIVGAGLGLGVASFVRHGRLLPHATIGASVLSLLCLQYLVLSGGPHSVDRLMAGVREHRQREEPIGSYGVLVRNLGFHVRGPTEDLFSEQRLVDFIRSTDRVLCVMGTDQLARLEANPELPLERLAQVRYLNPTALKIGMLLRPDPTRDLTTIVLVANR